MWRIETQCHSPIAYKSALHAIYNLKRKINVEAPLSPLISKHEPSNDRTIDENNKLGKTQWQGNCSPSPNA